VIVHRAKPRGLGPEYAAQFADESVADAYACRPPYPDEIYSILRCLMGGGSPSSPSVPSLPRRVLDLGCGRGEIARNLLCYIDTTDEIDALDASPAMIRRGRWLPGGSDRRLNWIIGRAEDAPLRPPYALVIAASSLHWMDWDIVLPRIRKVLARQALLAIFDDQTSPPPWQERLNAIVPYYSTNREFQAYRLIDELTDRGLFRARESISTRTVAYRQSIDDYVESFHSRNGFSRQRMSAADADTFDKTVRAIVAPHAQDGQVQLELYCTIHLGRPT
jgi:SAM-dependent methyltransferase